MHLGISLLLDSEASAIYVLKLYLEKGILKDQDTNLISVTVVEFYSVSGELNRYLHQNEQVFLPVFFNTLQHNFYKDD